MIYVCIQLIAFPIPLNNKLPNELYLLIIFQGSTYHLPNKYPKSSQIIHNILMVMQPNNMVFFVLFSKKLFPFVFCTVLCNVWQDINLQITRLRLLSRDFSISCLIVKAYPLRFKSQFAFSRLLNYLYEVTRFDYG